VRRAHPRTPGATLALFAYQWAGSYGLRNPSLAQRCFRDLFTGGQHIYVDRKS
jgi:hypothetical protein